MTSLPDHLTRHQAAQEAGQFSPYYKPKLMALHHSLAEKIAAALLTPYGGPEGTRLQIMLKRLDGTETNLGGNCKQNIINIVNQILEKS